MIAPYVSRQRMRLLEFYVELFRRERQRTRSLLVYFQNRQSRRRNFRPRTSYTLLF